MVNCEKSFKAPVHQEISANDEHMYSVDHNCNFKGVLLKKKILDLIHSPFRRGASNSRLRNVPRSSSQHMSPEEQLDIMLSQEKKMRTIKAQPSDTDLEASTSEFSQLLIQAFFLKAHNDLEFSSTEVYVLHQHCS